MNALYNFVSGPLVWIALALFAGGSAWRLWSLVQLSKKKDIYVHEYFSWPHALRSILHWIVPFANESTRKNPALTVVAFVFHLFLLALPLFVIGHVAMLDKALGLSWPTLPEGLADAMSFVVVGACVYFLARRLTVPEVKFVTSASDFVILALAAAPFVTGILAYHQIGGAQFMTILHMLSGEAMLVAIPFSRLSHMLYAPLTRAYIGSEFGAVRHARDW
ncbi:hypothetical protein NNJEOMEG_02312 [Fundidesulfovibrio magnetotacticus]|uniref:Nitrate reductase gamma subunit n=1 Tax=Fundidesulfovibrio magnetotacticus TaxID=2730080 RepID=A0A6V8LXU0_9BACT|nr:nitrate reductase [Fundidesulfovibrio magnetotacticus]GFK94467.1 hypothetical protein NNJEOMEG_02312 [Fundidesulfovibrio magnetotacticus]